MSLEFGGQDRVTPDEIMQEMLSDAIGLDNPMTEEAIAAGLEIVQGRIDNARTWLSWKPGDPPLDSVPYDSQAMAVLTIASFEA